MMILGDPQAAAMDRGHEPTTPIGGALTKIKSWRRAHRYSKCSHDYGRNSDARSVPHPQGKIERDEFGPSFRTSRRSNAMTIRMRWSLQCLATNHCVKDGYRDEKA